MELGKFTEEDAKKAMELFKLISAKGSFNFTVTESLKFAQLMSWYNTLPKRLQEASATIKQVVELDEPVKKTKSRTKK